MMKPERDRHLAAGGPKRILSLDGGGVRGLITLGMLARVEDILRARAPKAEQERFRLCDYFDLIGGTSTGALIAVQLAMGETVERIAQRYKAMCPQIFTKTRWFRYIESKLDSAAFDRVLERTFKEIVTEHNQSPETEPDMDTPLLRTGLAVVMKRIDTGSVWVLTNNPHHKFWNRDSPDWKPFWDRTEPTLQFYANGSYPLRRVVQASASAPFFLYPVQIDVDPRQPGLFLDGGASPFNNPSTELLMMAALKATGDGGNGAGVSPHGFGWETGRERLLMLSLGTGTWRVRHKASDFKGKTATVQAYEALRGIIADAEKNAQTWMQAISVAPRRSPEVDQMHYIDFSLGPMHGLQLLAEPLLTYRRVNPTLETGWLKRNLGADFEFDDRMIDRLRELDQPAKAHHDRCYAIGTETGQRYIADADFPEAFNLPGWQQAAAGAA